MDIMGTSLSIICHRSQESFLETGSCNVVVVAHGLGLPVATMGKDLMVMGEFMLPFSEEKA